MEINPLSKDKRAAKQHRGTQMTSALNIGEKEDGRARGRGEDEKTGRKEDFE